MQEKEEFQISVVFNPGLEPLTLTVTVDKTPLESSNHAYKFKIIRDQQILGVVGLDADHLWKKFEGNLNEDEVDDIGAAIDSHYD